MELIKWSVRKEPRKTTWEHTKKLSLAAMPEFDSSRDYIVV